MPGALSKTPGEITLNLLGGSEAGSEELF